MKSLLKVCFLVLIVVLVQYFYGWTVLFDDLKCFAEENNSPVVFLVIMSFGCAIGFPISFCTLFAGAAFGAFFGSVLSVVGIIISSFLGYYIGRFFCPKELIEKVKRKFSISSNRTMFDINFYVRAIPGLTYSMQNFVLGAMSSDIRMYMLLCVSIQGAIAVAMNVLGASFSDEGWAKYIAIAILVVVIIFIRVVFRRLYK